MDDEDGVIEIFGNKFKMGGPRAPYPTSPTLPYCALQFSFPSITANNYNPTIFRSHYIPSSKEKKKDRRSPCAFCQAT